MDYKEAIARAIVAGRPGFVLGINSQLVEINSNRRRLGQASY